MDIDFSSVNLQYLLRARDIAREDLARAVVLLNLSQDFADLLAGLTPEELTAINQIKLPLLLPRQETWWWVRLLKALQDGSPDEIQAVMDHLSLVTIAQRSRE